MSVRIEVGDCLSVLASQPDQSVNCCVTSPPYFGLRDYGHDGQIGLESTPDAYVAKLVEVFREVRRVLRDDGTLWLNLGDSYCGGNTGNQSNVGQRYGKDGEGHVFRRDGKYATSIGLKPKDIMGIPWRVAFALQADGWYLRSDIIWHKPNPMPESVTDRPTKAHEYIFLLSKSPRYYYDAAAIREDEIKGSAGSVFNVGKTAEHQLGRSSSAERVEDGKRNRRTVWTIATQPFSGAHFATFPPNLIEPCIKAGCPVGGTVLDPFGGAGTTGLVADRTQRNGLLIELNPEYAAMARERIYDDAPMFAVVQ